MARQIAPHRFYYLEAGGGLPPSRSRQLFPRASAFGLLFIAVLIQPLFMSHAVATDSPLSTQVVPVMVDVPAGDFNMGARSDGDDKQWGKRYREYPSRELPVHTVTLDAYKIGKYEITNAQFAAVLNWALEKGYLKDSEGARFSCKMRDGYSMADHPLSLVTWYGSVAFCNWLSEMLDLTPCYDLSTWKLTTPFPNGYRLPTEAEWERVAAWDPERPTEPVDRETVSGQATLEETADLIPCGAREFHRHWRRRNHAYALSNLHLRLCVLALLFSAMGFVISAEEQARSYGRFSPLFSSFKFLEYFFYNPDEWLLGVVIGGPLVAGALELIVLLILQFAKPPFRQRVTSIVIGVIAGAISIGCGLYYIALAMSFS